MIYKKMAAIKKELQNIVLKKTGKNEYAKFDYFELGDFLSDVVRLNEQHGVDDTIQISKKDETAKMILTDVTEGDFKVVEIPYCEAEMLAKGGAPSNVDAIQRNGSTITYLRRYLYITAYDILENDSIDNRDNTGIKENKPSNKRYSETPSNNTPKQENVATSEISTPTRQFELSTEPDEDKTELVLENNRTILKELMLKVKEIGERNNQSFDEIKRVSKEGITNYFINVLKFPVADGKPTKFELSSVERKPLVKGNVVVVYNEEFIANFTQYILDNEFMPF